jgi:hypothetical protein
MLVKQTQAAYRSFQLDAPQDFRFDAIARQAALSGIRFAPNSRSGRA